MNLQKFNPWNWFKHEDAARQEGSRVPVRRSDYSDGYSQASVVPQMYRELDRLWDIVGREFGLSPWKAADTGQGIFRSEIPARAIFRPELNVSSDEKEYTITVEAAGMEYKDISLELSDRKLLIHGNKSEKSEHKGKHFYRIERHYGNFQRVLDLPEDAIVEDISASMKNGLLSIIVPRREIVTSDSKKIKITSS